MLAARIRSESQGAGRGSQCNGAGCEGQVETPKERRHLSRDGEGTLDLVAGTRCNPQPGRLENEGCRMGKQGNAVAYAKSGAKRVDRGGHTARPHNERSPR